MRFRHNNNGSTYNINYGDNDIGRMRTQREFIKVLSSKIVSLNNASQIQSIIKSVFSNLDTNIELSKILMYVPYSLEFNTENLITNQLPGSSRLINDLWFYEVDDINTKEMIKQLLEELQLTEEDMNFYYN